MTKTIVIGHIGADAQVNTVNGKNVINFNVAHSEQWKDAQGNQQSKTTWFQVSRWTDKTGVVPYLKKGTLVYVEGKVEVKEYTKKDGTSGASLALTATEIQLLSVSKNEGESTSNATPANAHATPGGSVNDDVVDDLPF